VTVSPFQFFLIPWVSPKNRSSRFSQKFGERNGS
jgi:hypothetical protein